MPDVAMEAIPLAVRVISQPRHEQEVRKTAAELSSLRTYAPTAPATVSMQILPTNKRRSRAVVTLQTGATGAVYLCKQREVSNVTAGGTVGYLIGAGESLTIESSPEVWAVFILSGGQVATLRVLDEWFMEDPK